MASVRTTRAFETCICFARNFDVFLATYSGGIAAAASSSVQVGGWSAVLPSSEVRPDVILGSCCAWPRCAASGARFSRIAPSVKVEWVRPLLLHVHIHACVVNLHCYAEQADRLREVLAAGGERLEEHPG